MADAASASRRRGFGETDFANCDGLAYTKSGEGEGFVRLRQGYGAISSCQRRHPAEARAGFSRERRRMAEGEGFEPPVPFRVQWFSRPPPSTTRPSLPPSQAYNAPCFGGASPTSQAYNTAGSSRRPVLASAQPAGFGSKPVFTSTQHLLPSAGDRFRPLRRQPAEKNRQGGHEMQSLKVAPR